jgi:subtilisin family serine protease
MHPFLRPKSASALLLLGAALLVSASGQGTPRILELGVSAARTSAPPSSYVPGQILVKFKPRTSVFVRAAAFVAFESRAVARISRLDVFVLAIPRDETVEGMVEAFARHPDVAYVEPNYYCRISKTPNDTLFQYQYALSNIGQVIGSIPGSPQGKASADIKATAGWEETTGSAGVVIAVIDTGVELTHPDLKNKVVNSGRDFINNDFDASDDHGHGTMIAGIAAAETNNGEGVAGVSWNSKILPLKALDSQGNGAIDKIAEAIRYASDNGAQVINLSLGTEQPSLTLRDACQYAFNKGVFLAAAAGNGAGGAVHYPAAYDNYVFAVSATDYNDAPAALASIGSEIDAAAPGIRILAPYPTDLTPAGYLPYAYGDGTSFAAPHAAGLAALIKGLKPSLRPAQIMDIIRFSSADVNAVQIAGRDEVVGYGRIDIEKAVVPLIVKR